MTKTADQEAHELRKVEIVSKIAQAVLGVSLVVMGFFFADIFGQIRDLQEAKYDHETRLRLLEYQLENGMRGGGLGGYRSEK